MYRDCDTFANTDWNDPTGRQQARAIDWLWEQRQAKNPFEERAARNYCYFEGKQLREWSEVVRQMVLPTRYRNMKTSEMEDCLVFNVCRYLLNQKLAKLSRSDPIWHVPSYTSDEFDQTVARFSNELMAWEALHNLRIPSRNDHLLRHSFCSPVTFIEPYWDPTKGDPINITLDDYARQAATIPDNASSDMAFDIEERNRQMFHEDRDRYRQMVGYQGDESPIVQYSGDVSLRIRTIFEVMWYPFNLQDWQEECDAYLVSPVMTPEMIRARYGIPYSEIMRHHDSADLSERHEKINGAYSNPFIQQTYIGAEYDNGIIVHQLHVSKRVAPPNGATVIKLGYANTALRWGELGNASKKLPLYPFSEYPGTTHAVGYSSMDDIIPGQIEINDAWNKARQLRRKRVNAKILRDTSDKSHPDALKDDESVYDCDISKRPQVLYIPPEGLQEEKAIQLALRFMQDAVGIPDVTLGRTDDSDVQSGRGVLALNAGANERLATTGKALNVLWSDVGSHILTDLQHYAVEARITGIVGDDKRLAYRQWSAADLQPTSFKKFPDKTANVIVDTFSNIQQTPQERQAILLKMLELNAFPDERTRRLAIARVMGMDDVRTLFDPDEQARDRASDNLRRWQQGQMVPPPRAQQHHDEFIEVYEKFINDDDFLTLEQRNPAGAREVMEHIERHKQFNEYNRAMDAVRSQLAVAQASMDGAVRALKLGLEGAAQMLLTQAMTLGVVGGMPAKSDSKDKPQNNNGTRRAGSGSSRAEKSGADSRPRSSVSNATDPGVGVGTQGV